MIYASFALLGVFAGLLSGLFGIGGGLVIVPSLLIAFDILQIDEAIRMHLAIGTSLSIIFVTVLNSAYAHHKRGGIDWPTTFKIVPALAIGTFLGAMVSSFLSAKALKIFFGIYVTLVAIKMWMDVKVEADRKETSNSLFSIVGFIIGFKSAVLGIGGGTISIPFLTWRGFSMKHAVGVSANLGVPIAFVGALTYMYNGRTMEGLPEYSIGLVYLPAFIGVILTSTIFARIGAKLAYGLDQMKMKKGFAIFLMIVAFKTLYEQFTS